MQLTIGASGPLELEKAWQRYLRPQLWSTWSPQIARVECGDEQIAPGTHGTVRSIVGVSVDFQVTAVDPAQHSWSWRVQAPFGIRIALQHGLFREKSGTRTTLRLDGPALVVLGYAPIAKLALGKLLRP